MTADKITSAPTAETRVEAASPEEKAFQKRYRAFRRRDVLAVVDLGRDLCEIKAAHKEERTFTQWRESLEPPLEERQCQRWMSLVRLFGTKDAPANKTVADILSAIGKSALYDLAAPINDGVWQQVRAHIEAGEKLTTADVQAMLAVALSERGGTIFDDLEGDDLHAPETKDEKRARGRQSAREGRAATTARHESRESARIQGASNAEWEKQATETAYTINGMILAACTDATQRRKLADELADYLTLEGDERELLVNLLHELRGGIDKDKGSAAEALIDGEEPQASSAESVSIAPDYEHPDAPSDDAPPVPSADPTAEGEPNAESGAAKAPSITTPEPEAPSAIPAEAVSEPEYQGDGQAAGSPPASTASKKPRRVKKAQDAEREQTGEVRHD